MTTVICEVCRAIFHRSPSLVKRAKHNYCSKKCMGIAFRKPELWEAHNCLTCGQPILPKGGHYRKYCSRKCTGADGSYPSFRKLEYARWRDPEYIKRYMVKYVKEHRGELNIKARLRTQKNPELYRRIKRRWVENNPDAVRLLNYRRYRVKAVGEFGVDDWLDIKARHNNSCAICGKPEPEIKLEIDHIKPLSNGGLHIRENIQPLCRSCNARKGNRAWLEQSQGVKIDIVKP